MHGFHVTCRTSFARRIPAICDLQSLRVSNCNQYLREKKRLKAVGGVGSDYQLGAAPCMSGEIRCNSADSLRSNVLEHPRRAEAHQDFGIALLREGRHYEASAAFRYICMRALTIWGAPRLRLETYCCPPHSDALKASEAFLLWTW